MKADSIRLREFRNIQNLELTFCETANIIYGDNGQGKTNLLEAVWLFTGARSFRGARDSQLVRINQPQARLELEFTGQARLQTASITIEARRTAQLNEIPLKSPSALAGKFCAVVFSPEHLSLVKDGPQEKRRFIDTAVCQMKPRYLHMLTQYGRALDQRNRLLKELPLQPALLDTLDIWDARLASFAAVLVKTRASFLERLRPYAQELYSGISREKELFDFSYRSSLECALSGSIPDLEQQMLDALRRGRQEDLRARVTCAGPHRDDVELLLNGGSVRLYGSQGQQRSCVLALKLAECELIRETVGEYPVVLLDDVMSELDASRRDYLLNRLRGRQIFITCCDEKDFEHLGRGQGVRLENGAAVSVRQF